ncbi:carboxymuconolactone decarboxylase family protein [Halorhabdus rudnickae]|uniref:carboxymuconolactone decarboxylase family protein n=1 Tax=Halorhabdus rudnickae TaxID=1775544 RepID=UPI00108302E1|nr:carboxymuconolactone decarboxylase family protein [Halorhabdus rudnickae]
MSDEPPEFLDQLIEADPEFGEPVGEAFEQALTDGELPPKTKFLIMMALDAAAGHEEGVENLAEQARSAGASDAEILETIEVVTMTNGFQGLATGSAALQ